MGRWSLSIPFGNHDFPLGLFPGDLTDFLFPLGIITLNPRGPLPQVRNIFLFPLGIMGRRRLYAIREHPVCPFYSLWESC